MRYQLLKSGERIRTLRGRRKEFPCHMCPGDLYLTVRVSWDKMVVSSCLYAPCCLKSLNLCDYRGHLKTVLCRIRWYNTLDARFNHPY